MPNIKAFCYCCFLMIAIYADNVVAANISENDAINLLQKRLTDSNVYEWAKSECLGFTSDSVNPQYFEFSIYEKHSVDCGGDQAVRHMIDRFRVSRTQEKIEWYDLSNVRYVPFEQFLSRRK